MSPLSPVLLADIFDRFRIQLSDEMVNWLTPVWILCVGAAAGLILCGLVWCVLFGLSRIPFIGNLAESTVGRRVAVGVLTALLFVGALALFPGLRGAAQAQPGPAPAADQAGEAA